MKMKIVIESMVAIQRYKGDFDLRDAQTVLKGSRYQPEVFKGLLYDSDDPRCKVFLMADKTLRIHGTKSLEAAGKASVQVMEKLKRSGVMIALTGPLESREVIASHDIGAKLDPSKILEIFKGDRIIYDPRVIPGFILRIPSTSMEALIFPEGKIVVRGSRSIEDSASTLQMLASKIEPARIPVTEVAPKG
jgi:TATA-box binding protein (TBP) (component of TFIID and TFIIIB)